MDEMEFAQQFRPSGPVSVQDVLARQLAVQDPAELAEAAADREAAAAREERAERMAMLNTMAGNPLAELTRAQSAAAEARDTVRELEQRLDEARTVLRQRAEAVVDWGTQADEVMTGAARRSEVDLLGPAKAAHAQYVQATRAMMTGTARPTKPRRPFGGEVRRSELECWHCVNDNVSHEDSVLLHSDPEFAVPITTAEQAAQAERHGHASDREINR